MSITPSGCASHNRELARPEAENLRRAGAVGQAVSFIFLWPRAFLRLGTLVAPRLCSLRRLRRWRIKSRVHRVSQGYGAFPQVGIRGDDPGGIMQFGGREMNPIQRPRCQRRAQSLQPQDELAKPVFDTRTHRNQSDGPAPCVENELTEDDLGRAQRDDLRIPFEPKPETTPTGPNLKW